MTDRGRPEIGPALAAAWGHTRAAKADLRAWQDARLRRLVLHAYDAVPHYRRLFDRHRLHPRHIRGTVDLDLIPFSDKSEMQRQGPLGVLARGHDPEALHSVLGRGPSGEQFVVRRTWLEDKLQQLLRLRSFRAFGVRHRDRIVALGVPGQPAIGEGRPTGRSFRAFGFQPTRLIDGLQDPADVARGLRAAQPEVLVGLPGMLDRLAAPELADMMRGVRPRVVILGGEAATPAMRLRIRETFGAPIHETYVSHECPIIGWECRHSGDLHTCDDGVLVEVLRDGRPVEAGQRGEVVVTNLHAYAMPFIRYRIGDLATRGPACGCGAPFSTIGDIQEHIECFTLPDGRLLHPSQIAARLAWGPREWMRQYQLVQERRDRVVLYAVAAESASDERLEGIGRVVRPILGPGVEFDVRLVPSIPSEPTGKTRASRSLVLGA